MNTPKVNLLIIGAGRSGTTSLYQYLSLHKDICFSDIKEVHYFSIPDLNQRGSSYLESYFSTYINQQIIATADTYLLMDNEAPQRVYSYNPEMKLIALLREPVERAYSSYHYAINNGYQDKNETFLVSLKEEPGRLLKNDIIQKNNLCHFNGSLYYQHLQNWQALFSKENILIITTEELKNHDALLQKISSFLGIPAFPKNIEEIHTNKASMAKSKTLQQFLLNRNHPIRNILRPFIKPLKYLAVKTGVIDSIHKINKSETSYAPLSESEKKIVSEHFKQDQDNLKAYYNISFSK